MKVGVITKTNQKGQIVIPKKFREELGIDNHMALNLIIQGRSLYIFPVEEVVTKTDREISYLDLLKKTQGSWAKEDWKSLRKKRGRLELASSNKRKKAW